MASQIAGHFRRVTYSMVPLSDTIKHVISDVILLHIEGWKSYQKLYNFHQQEMVHIWKCTLYL